MANTYTQIYIHTVFAVAGRQSLIPKEHKADIYKYITGVIQNKKQKVMAINGMGRPCSPAHRPESGHCLV